MKQLSLFLLLSTFTLSACAPHPQDCARANVFCAGLVTDFGPVSEGIDQEAWLGLQDAKTKDGLDRIDFIETVDVRDRAKNIAAFANNGYDVIVTVGSSISNETLAAAKKYPKLLFIGVEQPQEAKAPNLAGLVFHEERSGFLSGVLAALMTQTQRVSAICEAKFIDPMRRYCDGFQAGARYINPQINATISYRDASTVDLFNDPDWGQTTALQQVQQGADVLFAAGGATADAALEAAASNDAYMIGAETDLYARFTPGMPNSTDIRRRLLTSATNDVRGGVEALVRRAGEGEFPSGEFMGEVDLAPFHELDRQIPWTVKKQLEDIKLKLENGSIHPDIPYKSP